MRCYAVLDTNIIVSALLSSKPDTATVLVVQQLFSDRFQPVVSKEILAEYAEVLHRPKFHFSPDLVGDFLTAFAEKAVLIEPTPTGETLPDMKDLPFYEVVMETQEDNSYLVTGNIKHFPAKTFIVTAREFLNILNEQQD